MKNKIKLILIFLISFLFLFSCEKEDINSGLIIKEHDFGECFDNDFAEEKEHIITDDSAYQDIKIHIIKNISGCENNPQRTAIDFSKYSLLGKNVGGGRYLRVIREVIDDKSNSRYIYTIKVKGDHKFYSGGVYMVKMNWVLVPKLPQGYTVKFEVK